MRTPSTHRPAANGAGTVRDALREPRGARAPLGALVGRLPLAIGVLVIVALVHGEGGSYSLAGVASCVFGLAMAVGHPWIGHRVDGERGERLLVVAALVCAAGWFALAFSTTLLASWTAVPAAALAGAAQPPLSPAMRARWAALMAPHALERAYAFETTVQEVAFVAGPLLLSLLLAFATPTVAALACGLLVIAGAVLFSSAPAPATPIGPAGPKSPSSRPMSEPGIRLLASTRGLCSISLGIALVCIPAFASAHGGSALTGVILAVWSLGSFLGGLLYGAVSWRAPVARRYLVSLAFGVLPMSALALAPGVGIFSLLAALSGLGLAPWVASGDALVQRLAPVGAITESFTWTASLGLVGEALGAVLAGILLDRAGLSAALAAGGAIAIAAFLLALAGNHLLREPGAGRRRANVLDCRPRRLANG